MNPLDYTTQSQQQKDLRGPVDYKLIRNTSPYLDQFKFKNDLILNLGDGKTDEINLAYHMIPNVPFHLMPPPPHNPNNNNTTTVFGRRGSWKSPLSTTAGQDVRCNSPHGSESDESCRSYKSRDSPPHVTKKSYSARGGRGGKGSVFMENTLVCSKFSASTPSIFYHPPVTHSNNGHYKQNASAYAIYRYYTNSNSNHQNNNNHQQNHNSHQIHHHQHRHWRSADNNNKKKPFTSDINRRVHGLMERFTSRAPMFRIPACPPHLLHMNEWDGLNQSIWDVYLAKAQKEDTYVRKLELWRMVYLSLQHVLLRYGLFLVGSTMSGLGLDSSDIDMCLLVRPCLPDPRNDALTYLKVIYDMLEGCDFIKSREIITAKVPILKFRDATYGFEVDLNCNNSVGIRNTHLLNCYARLDWRVRPLVAIVKLWAQANDINDAKRMTISSYSLALMVIHYLQCGVTPPAIPCLQGMYPSRFSPQIEIYDIDIQEEIPPFYSDNKQSVGEQFLGFLQYYAYFDYAQFAISVREGSLLPKEECRFARSPKNDATQWKFLCIEEPFDLTNTARSVYDEDTFAHIKNVFRLSFETLHKTKNLNSILPGGGPR